MSRSIQPAARNVANRPNGIETYQSGGTTTVNGETTSKPGTTRWPDNGVSTFSQPSRAPVNLSGGTQPSSPGNRNESTITINGNRVDPGTYTNGNSTITVSNSSSSSSGEYDAGGDDQGIGDVGGADDAGDVDDCGDGQDMDAGDDSDD